MKNVLSALAFSLFLLNQSIAQNWAPLNLSDKYNYRAGSAAFITNTIWLDSVTVNGADSVFHLNRIVTACDTCQLHWSGQAYKLTNQGQFLQKTMVKNPSGWFVFDGKSSFTINPNAELGESWLFDTVQNITANILDKSEGMTALGLPDSVKTIGLSNGGSLLLSKNYGFLNFPDFSGSNIFNLTGIEGRDLGEKVPGFLEFYDFEVGDVFMLYNYRGDGGSFMQSEDYTRIEILGKQVLNDTFNYDTKQRWLHIDSWNCGGVFCYDSTYGEIQHQVWTIANNQSKLTGAYPNQLIHFEADDEFSPCSQSYFYMQFHLDSLGRLTKSIEDLSNSFSPASTGYELQGELLVPNEGPDYCVFGINFKHGLGLTYLGSLIFESTKNQQLLGYIKGQDTVGIILSDEDLYVNAAKDIVRNNTLQLTPNPAHGQVNITAKLPFPVQEANITLRNNVGDLLQQAHIRINGDEIIESLNIEALPSGIYLLSLKCEGVVWTEKLVVY
jgi:Secretion system C-terminal sorting domain